MEIDTNPDFGHSPERTQQTASVIDDLLKVLVYAAGPERSAEGLGFPATVYTTLGSLWYGFDKLPELTGRLDKVFEHWQAEGALRRSDRSADPAESVAAFHDAMGQATAAAHMLSGALKAAQRAISDVSFTPEAAAAFDDADEDDRW